MANDMDTVQRLTKALTTVREHILDLLPGDAAGDDLKADLICLIDAALYGQRTFSPDLLSAAKAMMSEIKHTPGPWEAILWSEGRWIIKADDRNVLICTREEFPSKPAEYDANARLIAAAPDLLDAVGFARAALEALKGYEADCGEALPDDHELGRIEDSRHSPSFRIRVGHIRRLAAALAKAEGRS